METPRQQRKSGDGDGYEKPDHGEPPAETRAAIGTGEPWLVGGGELAGRAMEGRGGLDLEGEGEGGRGCAGESGAASEEMGGKGGGVHSRRLSPFFAVYYQSMNGFLNQRRNDAHTLRCSAYIYAAGLVLFLATRELKVVVLDDGGEF